jgi:hypothetical protein
MLERYTFARFFGVAFFSVASLAACDGGSLTNPPVASIVAGTSTKSATRVQKLYVTTTDTTYVYTYPGLQQTGELQTSNLRNSASDPRNDWSFFNTTHDVYVFKSGSLKPFAQMTSPPLDGSFDVAGDPTSSNIAISMNRLQSQAPGGYVAVWASPTRGASTFWAQSFATLQYMAYDASGNLFLDGIPYTGGGSLLAECPKNQSTFVNLSFPKSLQTYGSLEWDGKYMTMASGDKIYRFTVSGSKVHVVGTTHVDGALISATSKSRIEGDTLIGAAAGTAGAAYVGLWQYPQGGKPLNVLKIPNASTIVSITVSK